MSISQAMIRRLLHSALMLLLVVTWLPVQAQFVGIHLEIPAGVQFDTQVIESKPGDTWEKNKAMIWLSLETRENQSLILGISYPNREIIPTPEAFFLNDGTSDFGKSLKIGTVNQPLQMSNQGKLIKNFDPRPTHIQAWLGLPLLNQLSVTIEYF